MQIVQYVHRSGEELPDHARVTEVSAATADAVRPNAHGALDSLINDIKAGWYPETADAKADKAAADAAVAAAETALAEAKQRQADAAKALGEAQTSRQNAETAAGAPVTGNGGGAGGSTSSDKRGPLPDDFPGVEALRKADIDTYGKLRSYGDVTDVPGIGAATEAKIKAAM